MSDLHGAPLSCGVIACKVCVAGGYDVSRRYLTPAEARALAAELLKAADAITQDSAPCPVCSDCPVCGGSHTLPILDPQAITPKPRKGAK